MFRDKLITIGAEKPEKASHLTGRKQVSKVLSSASACLRAVRIVQQSLFKESGLLLASSVIGRGATRQDDRSKSLEIARR